MPYITQTVHVVQWGIEIKREKAAKLLLFLAWLVITNCRNNSLIMLGKHSWRTQQAGRWQEKGLLGGCPPSCGVPSLEGPALLRRCRSSMGWRRQSFSGGPSFNYSWRCCPGVGGRFVFAVHFKSVYMLLYILYCFICCLFVVSCLETPCGGEDRIKM